METLLTELKISPVQVSTETADGTLGTVREADEDAKAEADDVATAVAPNDDGEEWIWDDVALPLVAFCES